jgi:hypothetical protein
MLTLDGLTQMSTSLDSMVLQHSHNPQEHHLRRQAHPHPPTSLQSRRHLPTQATFSLQQPQLYQPVGATPIRWTLTPYFPQVEVTEITSSGDEITYLS